MPTSSKDITALLQRAQRGDKAAHDAVFPQVYEGLRQLAHGRLRRFRPGDTLNTTALVHEAYLKLVDQTNIATQDRAHFFALASRAMRFILVDYARSRSAEKRGGGAAHQSIDAVSVGAETAAHEVLLLDEAIERLMAHSERLGMLVEHKFFGGLTHEEIAGVTGRSVPTVKRDWQRARAWLYRYMHA